jgi:hypothetical protein
MGRFASSHPARSLLVGTDGRRGHRTDQHGGLALVAGDRRRMASHCARQAEAERLHRELRRPPARRTDQRNLVPLAHTRAAPTEWRLDYNAVRPHSSIGNLPPADYAKLSAPATGRDAARGRGLRTPPRCSTEPGRLKWPTDSAHPSMKDGAQVTTSMEESRARASTEPNPPVTIMLS